MWIVSLLTGFAGRWREEKEEKEKAQEEEGNPV